MLSEPAPPVITSSPAPPSIWSLKAVPSRVSAFGVPAKYWPPPAPTMNTASSKRRRSTLVRTSAPSGPVTVVVPFVVLIV